MSQHHPSSYCPTHEASDCGFGYDANERVPVVDFDYDAIDGGQIGDDGDAADNRSSREAIFRVLQLIARDGDSPREIGLRLLAFQYITNPEISHNKLAERMELDRSVASRRVQALRRELRLAPSKS